MRRKPERKPEPGHPGKLGTPATLPYTYLMEREAQATYGALATL